MGVWGLGAWSLEPGTGAWGVQLEPGGAGGKGPAAWGSGARCLLGAWSLGACQGVWARIYAKDEGSGM